MNRNSHSPLFVSKPSGINFITLSPTESVEQAPEFNSLGLGIVKIIGLHCTLTALLSGNRKCTFASRWGDNSSKCWWVSPCVFCIVLSRGAIIKSQMSLAVLPSMRCLKLPSLVRMKTFLLFPSLKLTA